MSVTQTALRSVLQRPKRCGFLLLVVIALLGINELLSHRHPTESIQGFSEGQSPEPLDADRRLLRVAVYNIHRGEGEDGEVSLDRIADTMLAPGRIDIAALNEVAGPSLPWGDSQSEILADLTDMHSIYAPTERRWLRDNQGNLLLSGRQAKRWTAEPLFFRRLGNSTTKTGRSFRNMITAIFDIGGREVAVLVTHLDTSEMNQHQLDQVLEKFEYLEQKYGYVLLLGDLNNSHSTKKLQRFVQERGLLNATDPALNGYSRHCVDWIIASGFALVESSFEARGASDHAYFWADLQMIN